VSNEAIMRGHPGHVGQPVVTHCIPEGGEKFNPKRWRNYGTNWIRWNNFLQFIYRNLL